MRRENILARVFRAHSGKTQAEAADEIGVPAVLIGKIETGQAMPSLEQLQGLARSAGLTVADGDEILARVETYRRRRLRSEPGVDGLFTDLADKLASHLHAAHRRLLTLPLPDQVPKAEDRVEAAALWARLEELDAEERSTVVGLAVEYQTWALCERVCREAEGKTAAEPGEAAALVRLAQEIAELVRGTEGWRNRLQGYVLLHRAHLLQQSGDPEDAGTALDEALRLWKAGSDPERLLDPGPLLAPASIMPPPASGRGLPRA